MHPSLFPYHPERDVYRLLQVDSTATSEEISAACRRLARTFHPDRNRSPRAHEEMGVINAVREMLIASQLDSATIEVASHGESDPLIKTGDEAFEPRNRRVDITVR